MIIATTPFIAGHRVVETKGQVFGLVVRSRGFSGNLIADLRSIGGGEIKEYTSLLEDARRQALDRLVTNATLMGANAVISMRFDSSELSKRIEMTAFAPISVAFLTSRSRACRRVSSRSEVYSLISPPPIDRRPAMRLPEKPRLRTTRPKTWPFVSTTR